MSIDIKIFQLAFERLIDEVEVLKEQNKQLRIEVDELKNNKPIFRTIELKNTIPDTVLLDTKEVLQLLGVCYNTLQKIVGKGLLTPIKINQRRVRYSKVKLIEYLENEQQENNR